MTNWAAVSNAVRSTCVTQKGRHGTAAGSIPFTGRNCGRACEALECSCRPAIQDLLRTRWLTPTLLLQVGGLLEQAAE